MLDDKLPEHLMRFGSSIHGTKPFWNHCNAKLSYMTIQIGCPTLFFTLSVADTKWPDVHDIIPSTTSINPQEASKWRVQNIIQNPHVVALYSHFRCTAFLETILIKLFDAIDYWYRYYIDHNFFMHTIII